LNSINRNYEFQSATSRWEEFMDSKSRFIIWIGEMEEILRAVPETKAELGEMKKLIERYKVNRKHSSQNVNFFIHTIFLALAR
jgi:hypothetical protein